MLAALTSEADETDLDINGLGGGPIASSRPHMEMWLGFATSDLTGAEVERLRPLCDAALDRTLDDVRFRKVHDALHTPGGATIVPPEHTRGAIYVVRDPRDVAVSFAHHSDRTHEWAVGALGSDETAMARAPGVLAPQVRQHLGTWSDHVRSWTEHELFPTLVVRYEDMAADPLGQLTRLAGFAGLDPAGDRLAAAVRSASFDALQEKERRVGFHERPGRDRPFFRSGRAGGWREELAPELAARIERDHGQLMRRLGYGPE
jgi:aryl sulfotransferase